MTARLLHVTRVANLRDGRPWHHCVILREAGPDSVPDQRKGMAWKEFRTVH